MVERMATGVQESGMWEEFLRSISEQSETRIAEALQRVDSDIRQSLISGKEHRNFNAAALARVLLFKALSVNDNAIQARDTSKKLNTLEWKPVVDEVHAFVASLPATTRRACCEEITDDTLVGFATLSSRTKGSQKKHFYSTLQLYAIYCAGTGKLHSDLLEMLISREDRTALNRARQGVAEAFRSDVPIGEIEEFTDVHLSFQVKRTDQEKMLSFAKRSFVSVPGRSVKIGFQFVVYRPRRRNPDLLRRSFVSVYDKSDDFQQSQGFTYSHHYQSASEAGPLRFSTGKVFPLKDAVYLVGGQRLDVDRLGRMPFESMKIMVIRWSDIEKKHTVFPVLILTSSYDNKVMASRGAGVLSPISHSSDLKLDSVLTRDLAASLKESGDAERSFILGLNSLDDEGKRGALEHFPLTSESADLERISLEISKYSNNLERDGGIAVDGSFRQRRGASLPLDTEALKSQLNWIGRGSKSKTYVNEDAVEFDFWKHVRFGPLRFE